MRRRAASAASGAVALLLGFGITHLGIQDRTPAGHRGSSQTIAAAYAPSALVLGDDEARFAREVAAQQADRERAAVETAAREAQEAEEAAEAERVAVRVAAAAAQAAESARKAAPAPKTTVTTVRSSPAPVAAAPQSLGSGACGGSLPPCSVMQRESGGDPTAVSPASYCGGRGCYGKWQYDPLTWAGYGGYANANLAPESVQDEKARSDWAGGAGCFHWNAC
jgi:hypothetical protein